MNRIRAFLSRVREAWSTPTAVAEFSRWVQENGITFTGGDPS